MKLGISENIRKLRREADMTQEKLAEFLCVSPQTVSKWERDETYPDIETLPIIANFFGVTVDELIGNDRSEREEKIERICKLSEETARVGKEEEALLISREGYRKYPYSYKMMVRYASDLLLYSNRENWEAEKGEIKRIAELILDECSVDALRYSAIGFLLQITEDKEAYRALCERVPEGFNFTREMCLEYVYDKDTGHGMKLRQENMLELLWWFRNYIFDMCGIYCFNENSGPEIDPQVILDVCKMELAIYNCLFRDGDYLNYSWNVAFVYYKEAIALMKTGKPDQAADAIAQMSDYAVQFWTVPASAQHTSLFVNQIEFNVENTAALGSCGSPEYYLHSLKHPLYDFIRKDIRFVTACQKLRECPKGGFPKLEKDFKWLQQTD